MKRLAIAAVGLALVACSRGTAPPLADHTAPVVPTLIPIASTQVVPPTVATCTRAEIAPWANEAGDLIDQVADIGDRYNAAAQTGDVSLVKTTSGSLESETSNLLSRFNDLGEPPCATEFATTFSLVITNVLKGLGAAKDGDFDATTRYFNEYSRLLDVASAQLQQLQRAVH